MRLHQLTNTLLDTLELNDRELIRSLRASWNPDRGTVDGRLVGQLEDRIQAALPSIADDFKRDACNELADAEGLSRIDVDLLDSDSWIREALLEPVLDELFERQ